MFGGNASIAFKELKKHESARPQQIDRIHHMNTTGGASVLPDGASRRQTQPGPHLIFYDGLGRLAGEYVGGALSKEYVRMYSSYVPSSTELLAIENAPGNGSPCSTCFLLTDDLGSVRLVGDVNGNYISRHDFLPFGEETSSSDPNRPVAAGFTLSDSATQRFTGKERDSESGLDDFGARYYGSALGRFTSPDPHTGTLLHIINPQRWNMYAYGLNNPLFYTDPSGKDAIAVGLTNEVPVFGHAGIISVHKDGTATYADYGPVSGGLPWDEGHTVLQDLPKVSFDSDGTPTQASFDVLAAAVGKIKGQNPDSIKMSFFKTSEADTAALDSWLLQQYKRNLEKNSQTYVFYGNSCADFCERGLMIGGAPVGMTPMSAIPNLLLLDLEAIADKSRDGLKPKVDSKVCFPDDDGKCQQ